MIVKIFCAVLVVLGVSVAIVLGGLIILASCVSGRKNPAGDNTADEEDTFMYKLYAGILPITFSTLPRFLYSIQKVESDLPISILHFCIPFFILSLDPKKNY